MKTLKENFGRRMTVIGAAIATLLVALVLVAAFTVQAKADPNAVIDNNNPYNANQNSLTALVHASASEDFTVDFDYTVTKVSLGKSEDPVDLAKMPDLGNKTQVGHIGLNLSVDHEQDPVVFSSTTGATVADGKNNTRREGAGSPTSTAPGIDLTYAENGEDASAPTAEYWTWADSAEKCYFVQLPFSVIVDAATWTTPGEYEYRIHTEQSSVEAKIPASKAVYNLRIFVAPNATSGDLEVTGYILSQSKHDDGLNLNIQKKDPRRGFGNSNHLHGNPDFATEGTDAKYYYYGFTFSHAVKSEPESFYLQKKVQNNNPDLTVKFPMTLDFYHTGWTGATGEIEGGIIGVICDVAYASIDDDNPSTADLTPVDSVTFAWDASAGAYRGTFNLKHSQRIIFDGATSYTPESGTPVVSTKVPALTAYTCLENMESDATKFAKYTANAMAYNQTSADGEVQYYLGEGGTDTPSPTKGEAKNMFITYFNDDIRWQANSKAYIASVDTETPPANKAVITNIYDYTPTNFWIDMLPYVVMIGIPVAAFVIWMLARRKKFNR